MTANCIILHKVAMVLGIPLGLFAWSHSHGIRKLATGPSWLTAQIYAKADYQCISITQP